MRLPRRILVTGAGGFVGRHLLHAIHEADASASVFANHFDITDPAAIDTALREAQPDACVHLAAIAAVPAAGHDPDAAWRVNLHGTLRLAERLRAQRSDALFLFVSSAEVYGESFRAGDPVNEGALLAPMNLYATTKAACDLAIGQMARSGLHAVRLRPFNHTGPGQSDAFVVSAFARQLAMVAAGLQPPVLRVGALEPRRDFLDVRDVCRAYVACLGGAEQLSPGLVLNIASGIPRRVGDILDMLVALSGQSVTIETEHSRLRPGDIASAAGDSSRIRTLFGWKPHIAWEQTLRDTLDHWRRTVRATPIHAA